MHKSQYRQRKYKEGNENFKYEIIIESDRKNEFEEIDRFVDVETFDFDVYSKENDDTPFDLSDIIAERKGKKQGQ